MVAGRVGLEEMVVVGACVALFWSRSQHFHLSTRLFYHSNVHSLRLNIFQQSCQSGAQLNRILWDPFPLFLYHHRLLKDGERNHPQRPLHPWYQPATPHRKTHPIPNLLLPLLEAALLRPLRLHHSTPRHVAPPHRRSHRWSSTSLSLPLLAPETFTDST